MKNLDKIIEYVETTTDDERFLAICVLVECIEEHRNDMRGLRKIARCLIDVSAANNSANVSAVIPELADLMEMLIDDASLQQEFQRLQEEASLITLWVDDLKVRAALCRILDHKLDEGTAGGSALGFVSIHEAMPLAAALEYSNAR